MAPQPEDYMGRPLYAYDLPPQLLGSITLKLDVETSETVPTLESKRPSSPSANETDSTNDASPVGSQSCSMCGLTFSNVLDQRGHLKSDLHNYNLKQKLRGRKPVSETEFEKLVEDLDESLSGSDSDDDDDEEEDSNDTTLTALLKRQAKIADRNASANDDDDNQVKVQNPGRTPLLWFSSPLLPKNHFFAIYRALFTNEQQKTADFAEELRKKQLDPVTIPHPAKDGTLAPIAYKGPHIFLCMIGGGHFAAMVVSLAPRQSRHNAPMNREATVLAHKTFHRYTTRRKQGGSQSANDNAKGAAHSAGSTLRRYNEQALVEDVRELLHDWKALLDTSELMFIRATGITNRRTLYGPYDNQVLRHTDPRMRGFPFNTRRPTQKELMRCFIELTRLKVREIDPASEVKPEKTTPVTSTPSTPKPSKPKLTEAEQSALLHTSQLQAFIRRSKLPALLAYVANNKLSADFAFQPAEAHHHTPYPLHLAASQNAAPMVLGILTRGSGASPLLRNAEGKTPFELAGDRATRDAFRVARAELGESRWDWEAAGVPAAMSRAEAEQRNRREQDEADAKEAERRRAEEERLKKEGPKVPETRHAGGKAGQVLGAPPKTAQERREEEARGLTPEMRLRLDRERRARAAEERLKKMQGK
ncbi:ankyrin repeat and zinc finger domain containing protein 1 [Cordyceps fumosorosea ARSEF 2679]|uniref:Ankyrin repeat and zinc finger domain containing protein 1 n=1 Tax=Cordyceps fumosorosea (strain ARSEF 2679) TaxID=1081104 RepID=A0A167SWR8_CORFA|nr:ankyrin repeat and zinc finger domain containing protein 1 [Cordyceps fumosorosea ARSEF 2679]OAA60007.1 ankyrin repeat and zinc finger domain containing protein 1 [Cordyceps fumosorosea ARSEF 2679]